MSHEGSIIVVDEHFHEARVPTPDRRPTGQQIVAAAGHQHTDQFFVLANAEGGGLQEISQKEHVEIAADGSSRFFVIKGDTLFRFEIEGNEYLWPVSPIAGRILYDIAGVKHDEFTIWQKIGDDLLRHRGAGRERPVLGRVAGAHREFSVPRVLDERVEPELGCAFHDRPRACPEELGVLAE